MDGGDVMAEIPIAWTAELEWYTMQPKAHPNTSGWGTNEKGRNWFCTTHSIPEYWDGSAVQELLIDVTEDEITLSDVTTNNSSLTKHGLLKKLDDDTTHFMRGDGQWAVPAGASGAPGAYTYLIKLNGSDAEAYNSSGTLVYGGSGDAGSVDGGDHQAVFQACIDAIGDSAGGIIFVKNGTYDFDSTLRPRNHQVIIGESKSYTILRPSGSGVTPVISYNRTQGTSSRMEKCVLANFKIDSRSYASSVGIEIYNLKDSLFEHLWFNGQKECGMFLSGTSNGYTFWNKVEDLLFDMSSSETDSCCIRLEKWVYDMWFERLTGMGSCDYALWITGAHVVTFRDFWIVNPKYFVMINPNYGETGDGVTGIDFEQCTFDCTPSGGRTLHMVYADRSNSTVNDIHIEGCKFMQPQATANTYDLVYLTTASSTISRVYFVGNDIYSTCNHRYIMNFVGAGSTADIFAWDNNDRAGQTGNYNISGITLDRNRV
jgi:hypothetical protein